MSGAKRRRVRTLHPGAQGQVTDDFLGSAVACALVLLIMAYFGWLARDEPGRAYIVAQEDEFLEWGTFWAFTSAWALGLLIAFRQWKGKRLPCFTLLVAFFCLAVAMEEISWGQRLIGFRPPEYFLANNYQQELTVHNVVGQAVRDFGLRATIVGYGILLPLLGLVPFTRRLFARTAVVAPTPWLVPVFAVILGLQLHDPWSFTDEVVECLVGLGFLSAAVILVTSRGRDDPAGRPGYGGALWTAAAFVLVAGLGVATAAVQKRAGAGHPVLAEVARRELDALGRDLSEDLTARGPRTGCGYQRRVYTYVTSMDASRLRDGAFATLNRGGPSEERASYFLDPWNMPYWIRHDCPEGSGEQVMSVFSFGPNRRRDSSSPGFQGDDVAATAWESR